MLLLLIIANINIKQQELTFSLLKDYEVFVIECHCLGVFDAVSFVIQNGLYCLRKGYFYRFSMLKLSGISWNVLSLHTNVADGCLTTDAPIFLA